MNNTPAARPDDAWPLALLRQRHEPGYPEQDLQLLAYEILQHEAAAVAKARIKSRENLLSKLERTYTRIIDPVKDSPMILTEEAKNYNKFVDDLRLFIDIERKRNDRIAELQRHAQEGGAGE